MFTKYTKTTKIKQKKSIVFFRFIRVFRGQEIKIIYDSDSKP